MIHFLDVDSENYRKCCRLEIREDQKRFVSNAIGILGRAYAFRDDGARVRIICEDETMVGMLMTRFWPEDACYILDQFFIDWRFQRRGYGKAAIALLLEELAEEGRFPSVYLCYLEGNEEARDLYLQAGFQHNGDDEEGEIGMSRQLR